MITKEEFIKNYKKVNPVTFFPNNETGQYKWFRVNGKIDMNQGHFTKQGASLALTRSANFHYEVYLNSQKTIKECPICNKEDKAGTIEHYGRCSYCIKEKNEF